MTVPVADDQDPARCSREDRILGRLSWWLSLLLVRRRFRRTTSIVTALGRHVVRPATPAEACAMVAAVRAAARGHLGRAACLERSLAVALLARLRRRRVDWCIGARLMPYAGHAWIELDGRPIGEPAEPDRPYLVLLRI